MQTTRRRASGPVEMRVIDEGEVTLHYTFSTLVEAITMHDFLKEFFPSAKFVIDPILQ